MDGHFIKMHGLGNDFVVIDARVEPVAISSSSARAIADRRIGIGCDQLIVIEPSTTADVRMRIWNADGSEVESCGNATRCVASLLGQQSTIETAGGLLIAHRDGNNITVDLPPPTFDWERIPLSYPMDTAALPLAWDDLANPMAVNVGNPHVVFFVPDADAIDLERLGPLIESDVVFPERINVNVAHITGPSSLRLRVWERGVGLTRACGTGACATAVAAIQSRRAGGPVTVDLDGGRLMIDWQTAGVIHMSGPATEVFRGTLDWAQFA